MFPPATEFIEGRTLASVALAAFGQQNEWAHCPRKEFAMCKLNSRQANIDLVAEGLNELEAPSYKLGYYNFKLLMGDKWSPELYTDEVYFSERAAKTALKHKVDEFDALMEGGEWYDFYGGFGWSSDRPIGKQYWVSMPYFEDDNPEPRGYEDEGAFIYIEEVTE